MVIFCRIDTPIAGETVLKNEQRIKEDYHVKDPSGAYCRWDASLQKFVSVGKTDYSTLTPEKLAVVSFTTSINGSISKIPVRYTVEVRDVLAGTKFRVQERPWDIPDGYSFQKYRYNGEDSENKAEAGITDVVTSGINPHVDVCNLKGWGLRVNKIWTDADFMTRRDATYFAVYTENEYGENPTLVPGTVRSLARTENPQTLYWYFLPLPVVDVPFAQYQIWEVAVTDPVVDDNGNVTSCGEITPIKHEGVLTLKWQQVGETTEASYDYTVLYSRGAVDPDSNVRVDTVTNNRPGIVLKKQDWDNSPLSGAKFVLAEKETGIELGTFISDEQGLITTAFLGDNKDYTLTETETPQGYQGIGESVTIRLDDGTVSVSGIGEEYYTLDQGTGKTPTLTLKNRPYTFRAVKTDGTTGMPLQDVSFDLYQRKRVDTVYNFELFKENLTTASDGVIPGVDQTLPAGTYELREKTGPDGYQPISAYIQFSVSSTGTVTLSETDSVLKPLPEGVKLSSAQESDGTLAYTLTIPNYQKKNVTILKTDLNDAVITAGAGFALYQAADYDDISGKPYDGKTPLISGTNGETGILPFGALPVGDYRLVETMAPPGYIMPDAAIHITISADSVTATKGSENLTVTKQTGPGQEADIWQIQVKNTPGMVLPETGGRGTGAYSAFGLALVLAAAGAMLLQGKKRKNGKS